MTTSPRALLLVALLPALPSIGVAQGYRVRLESRVQSVAYRGVTPDSIARSEVRVGANGVLFTPDGIAVSCIGEFCQFFRPGPIRRSGPLVTRLNLMGWDLGVAGLTVHANLRHATDLGSDDVWPAIRPSLQLIEGYAQLERGVWMLRAGRQTLTGRLGILGLDGGKAVVRVAALDLDGAVYGGWGLTRGASLPVTSRALNPLDDFQPRDRQIVAGAELGWRPRFGDIRAEYRREIDPASDFFVSERAAASATIRPFGRLTIFGGGEYDLAMGFAGSAEANVAWAGHRLSATIGVRQYRPFFDLWTIWGAFSPVPYHAYVGSLILRPRDDLTLSARGEVYSYDNTGAETGLVRIEDDGWRWNGRATWSPHRTWQVIAGLHAESGPGAASRGFDGRVTRRFSDNLTVSVEGGRVERPLEFRFDEATVNWLGADAEAQLDDRWQLTMQLARYREARDRPDAAAFDWNQLRLNARISVLLRSDSDRAWLPPRLGSPRQRRQ